jgi:hypothetical protein
MLGRGLEKSLVCGTLINAFLQVRLNLLIVVVDELWERW